MNRNMFLSVVVCISFLTVLSLYGLAKNVQGEEGKTTTKGKSGDASAKEKFSEEKKEFQRKAKAKLNELDREIDELKVDLKKAGSKIKAEAKEGMQELEEKRAALKKEMKKLESKSKKQWEEAKQKIQAVENDLEEAYRKVRAKFKSE